MLYTGDWGCGKDIKNYVAGDGFIRPPCPVSGEMLPDATIPRTLVLVY